MINLIERGLYRLTETPHHMKLLSLSRHGKYILTGVEGIGDILAISRRPHRIHSTFSAGDYVIYSVKGEDDLSDQLHMELDVGHDQWQGYLLPTGLPHGEKIRSRIIPTNEVITHNPIFKVRKEVPVRAAG